MFLQISNSNYNNYGPRSSLFPNISEGSASGPLISPTFCDYLIWLARVGKRCYDELFILSPYFIGLSLFFTVSLLFIVPTKIINQTSFSWKSFPALVTLSKLFNINLPPKDLLTDSNEVQNSSSSAYLDKAEITISSYLMTLNPSRKNKHCNCSFIYF